MNYSVALKYRTTISVITPTYNTDHVIFETAQSVLKQTFDDFEWLIVNDGSTDSATLSHLVELSNLDTRIKVITHQINKGLPASRNTGINNALSPYLFFIDADDLIDSTFLEKAFIFLENNHQFHFANSFVVGFGAQDYKWSGGFHDREVFLYENRNTSCFMARREVFNQILFDESMRDGCEDWDFWLNAASNGFWGYTIPEYLFYYRRTSESKWASLRHKSSVAEIQKKLFQRYGSTLKSNFPKLEIESNSFRTSDFPFYVRNGFDQGGKKLLCILPWLQLGGADQFNLHVLEGLKHRGWYITIVTTLMSNNEWENRFLEITKDIFHLAHLGTEATYFSLLTYLIESRNPNVIYLSHSQLGYYLLPLLKQRFPLLPILDYLHCLEPDWFNGGYPFFSSVYSHCLDQTLTSSHNLREWCISQGIREQKVDVCFTNIDTTKVRREVRYRNEIRASLGIADKIPVILFVARLTEQKQPLVFVKTLAKLKAQGYNFKAIAIGDGPDKELFEKSIQQHSLESIISFQGNKSNEEVLQYMDASDLFFLPSRYEGIALSIYEAMAKELAIVGADVGGQAELVTNDCGFLLKPKSPDEDVDNYVQVLSYLLSNPTSMYHLGKNGRLRVEGEFSLEKMIDQLNYSFLNIRAGRSKDDEGVHSPYMMILNRMLILEKENKVALEITKSNAVKILIKLKQPYLRYKNLYSKLRRIIKR